MISDIIVGDLFNFTEFSNGLCPLFYSEILGLCLGFEPFKYSVDCSLAGFSLAAIQFCLLKAIFYLHCNWFCLEARGFSSYSRFPCVSPGTLFVNSRDYATWVWAPDIPVRVAASFMLIGVCAIDRDFLLSFFDTDRSLLLCPWSTLEVDFCWF